MTKTILRRRRPDYEAALLAPATHAPAATHLRQAERDNAPLRFDDVTPARPAYTPPATRRLVPGSARPVLDELRADLDVVHAIQRAAEPPPTAADFFAHYVDDLRVRMEMHGSLQVIAGILFESDDALEAVIVEALLPIAEQLAVTL